MGKIKHNDYYDYVNKLQTYAIQHPEWFWSDDSKAQEARQWLYNNGASAIIDTIYDETPDNLKPKDRKKWTKDRQEKVGTKEMKDKIHEGQKEFLSNAFDTTMRSMNILGTPLDFYANQKSNGDYQTFGELVRKGNDWGVAGNIGAEF